MNFIIYCLLVRKNSEGMLFYHINFNYSKFEYDFHIQTVYPISLDWGWRSFLTNAPLNYSLGFNLLDILFVFSIGQLGFLRYLMQHIRGRSNVKFFLPCRHFRSFNHRALLKTPHKVVAKRHNVTHHSVKTSDNIYISEHWTPY